MWIKLPSVGPARCSRSDQTAAPCRWPGSRRCFRQARAAGIIHHAHAINAGTIHLPATARLRPPATSISCLRLASSGGLDPSRLVASASGALWPSIQSPRVQCCCPDGAPVLWLRSLNNRAAQAASPRPHRAGGAFGWRFAPAEQGDAWQTTTRKEVFQRRCGHGGKQSMADCSELTVRFFPSGESGAATAGEVDLWLG